MAVTITGLDREFNAVVDALVNECGKDDHKVANKILSNVCQNASSGKRRFTKAVTAARIRQDMNKPVGKRGRAILRFKHVLATKSLKGQGRKADWDSVKKEAERLLRLRLNSRSFLRAGWLWPAYQLGLAAGTFGTGNRGQRGFRRGGNSAFGPKAAQSKRVGSAKVARKGDPTARAFNLAPQITASRSIPDYANGIFSRGNPTEFKAIGERGLQKAMTKQLAFERRTLPKALETCARRAAKKGRRLGASAARLL